MNAAKVKKHYVLDGSQLAKDFHSLTPAQAFIKRSFDISGAFTGLLLTWWLILLAWILASLDTRSNGFFTQERVGREGMIFKVIKIRTMRPINGIKTNVTVENDPRITSLGKFWRKTKIDELPQLINVLKGEMSFVGPRPDVPGYADILEGQDRTVLNVRPGITGPATLKYRDEEILLSKSNDPETYNREIVWPDKVRLNREYVENWSFWQDLVYIWRTLFS
jgi:lipopolysaccharide/colanic/teichoic acid biosynthesis glycosyltransferase